LPTPFENPVGQATNQQYENQYGQELRRSAHSTNPSATDWHFMTIALGSGVKKHVARIARRTFPRCARLSTPLRKPCRRIAGICPAAGRPTVMGMGATQPVADNRSDGGRSKNRRGGEIRSRGMRCGLPRYWMAPPPDARGVLRRAHGALIGRRTKAGSGSSEGPECGPWEHCRASLHGVW
jgi:hypothetical protein